MNEVAEVIGKSIVEEKMKHATGAITAGGGTTIAMKSPIPSLTGDWAVDALILLPYFATAAGLALSLLLFYKAYMELKLVKIRIANEEER